MLISKEEKKAEAIKRMKKIGLFDIAIEQFEEDDLVNYCEPPHGTFYWMEGNDLKAMRRFEKKYNALVYCVIRSSCIEGIMDTYLYVSDFKAEWPRENSLLANNMSIAYVENKTYPVFSEGGIIGFKKTPANGLVRVR